MYSESKLLYESRNMDENTRRKCIEEKDTLFTIVADIDKILGISLESNDQIELEVSCGSVTRTIKNIVGGTKARK